MQFVCILYLLFYTFFILYVVLYGPVSAIKLYIFNICVSVRVFVCVCTGELIGVEYLYSQTSAVLQQDLGDPDAPGGTAEEEAWGGSDEGFEEEEEEEDEPEEICLLEHHSALLQSANLTRPPASQAAPMEVQQAEEEEEEEDILGPDGRGGYQHVVALAQALVKPRHRRYVTPRQAREITALWQNLSDWDKVPVKFTPMHKDRLVQGRFKNSHRHAHTPGVDSVKR